jgi:hypothetical protein
MCVSPRHSRRNADCRSGDRVGDKRISKPPPLQIAKFWQQLFLPYGPAQQTRPDLRFDIQTCGPASSFRTPRSARESGFGLPCLNHACDATSVVLNYMFGGSPDELEPNTAAMAGTSRPFHAPRSFPRLTDSALTWPKHVLQSSFGLKFPPAS